MYSFVPRPVRWPFLLVQGSPFVLVSRAGTLHFFALCVHGLESLPFHRQSFTLYQENSEQIFSCTGYT